MSDDERLADFLMSKQWQDAQAKALTQLASQSQMVDRKPPSPDWYYDQNVITITPWGRVRRWVVDCYWKARVRLMRWLP